MQKKQNPGRTPRLTGISELDRGIRELHELILEFETATLYRNDQQNRIFHREINRLIRTLHKTLQNEREYLKTIGCSHSGLNENATRDLLNSIQDSHISLDGNIREVVSLADTVRSWLDARTERIVFHLRFHPRSRMIADEADFLLAEGKSGKN